MLHTRPAVADRARAAVAASSPCARRSQQTPVGGTDAVGTVIGAVWAVRRRRLRPASRSSSSRSTCSSTPTASSATFVRLFPRARAAARRRRLPPRRRPRSAPGSAGSCCSAAIIGSTAALGLWLMGVPYFYVLALIAGIGEMIPIVGPLLVGDPGDRGGLHRVAGARRSASRLLLRPAAVREPRARAEGHGAPGRRQRGRRHHRAAASAARCSASSARSSRCRPRRSCRCCSRSWCRRRRRTDAARLARARGLHRHHARRDLAARPRARARRRLGPRRLGAQHVDPRVGLRAAARDPRAATSRASRTFFDAQHLPSGAADARLLGAPLRRRRSRSCPSTRSRSNPILCYNLLFLSTFVLSGLGMYLLVRELTGNPLAAFVAGLLFAFAPYRLPQSSHLQVLSSQWMPFALYGFRRYFRHGGARAAARPRDGTGVGGGGAGRAEPVVRLLPALLLAVRRAPTCCGRSAQRGLWRDRRVWLHLGAAGVVAVALTAPFLLPYAAVRAALRHGADARPRSCRLLGRRLLLRHGVRRAAALGRRAAGVPQAGGRAVSRAGAGRCSRSLACSSSG